MKYIRMILTPIILFIDFLTRPKPLQRSSEAQSQVEEKTKSMSLYQFAGCPFCVRVRRAIRRLNLPIETRDALNEQYAAELTEQGGKRKVPCLRIKGEGQDQWMYDSKVIIAHLTRVFGTA